MGIGPKISFTVTALALSVAGCNQPRAFTAQAPPASGWQEPNITIPNAQVQDLGRRATALDADNRDLHSELARSQQQAQLLTDEVSLLRSQLLETAAQVQDLQLAKQEADKQLETFTTSALRGGGVILKANNSLMASARLIRVPGAEVRQDGDVLRIELPADRLFHPGTSQLQPAAYNLLDQAADSLTRAFPRQLIGVEGHSDSGTNGAASPHQLTSAQSVAVVDVLARRNRIPANQLFTVGQGSNHPLASNATAAGRAKNRRVELVVYPETVQ
jgi:chemotaxis protein MotB